MESYRSKAQQNAISVATIYKQKVDKVRLVNLLVLDKTVIEGIIE